MNLEICQRKPLRDHVRDFTSEQEVKWRAASTCVGIHFGTRGEAVRGSRHAWDFTSERSDANSRSLVEAWTYGTYCA